MFSLKASSFQALDSGVSVIMSNCVTGCSGACMYGSVQFLLSNTPVVSLPPPPSPLLLVHVYDYLLNHWRHSNRVSL